MNFTEKNIELNAAERKLGEFLQLKANESNKAPMIELWQSQHHLKTRMPVSKQSLVKLRIFVLTSSEKKVKCLHQRVSVLIREIDRIRRIRHKSQPSSSNRGDNWSEALRVEYKIGSMWSQLLTTNADAQNYIAAHYHLLLLKRKGG